MKNTLFILSLCAFITHIQAQSFFSNQGFEQWDSFEVYQNPSGWFTLNELTAFGFEPSTQITTDAYSGSFAVRLTSKSGNFNDISGILASGPILDDNFMPDFSKAKMPYDQRPTHLKFYYKAMPQYADTCALFMLLTKWNVQTQQSDTVGIASFSTYDSVMVYTEALIPFEYYTTQTPDSAFFIATSSINGFNPTPGSTFILDEISLLEAPTSINHSNKPDLLLYPVPATNQLFIDIPNIAEQVIVSITDLQGRLVYTQNFVSNHVSLPISDYQAGVYIVSVQTNELTLQRKFLKHR